MYSMANIQTREDYVHKHSLTILGKIAKHTQIYTNIHKYTQIYTNIHKHTRNAYAVILGADSSGTVSRKGDI